MRIKLKQHDYFDCGAVCIASVCAYYKYQISIAQVRHYANTDMKGTTVFGLIEASKKIGFLARGIKADFDALPEITMPVIAHVKLAEVGNHFVVIYKITKKQVKVMDPEDGKYHLYTHEFFKGIWSGILVLLAPSSEFQTGGFRVARNIYIFNLIKPHRKKLFQILFGALIYTLLGLSTSIYIQKITDYVFVDRNLNLLNVLSIGMIIILAVQAFIGFSKNYLSIRMGQTLDINLILGYYKHLITLPQTFFDGMRVGEIISRINDAVKIRIFINDIAVNLFLNLSVVIFSVSIMLKYNWRLGLIILLIVPVYAIMYIVSNKLNKAQQRKLMESSAELESQLVESINLISTIKKFGVENYFNQKTEAKFVRLLKKLYTNSINNSSISIVSDFSTKIFTTILFWVGGQYVVEGTITPGELFSFYSLLGYLTGPISSVIASNKSIQEAMIASDRLFDIMELKHEDEVNENITLKPENIGDIKFENVNFHYGARIRVFEDFSITIPAGKTSAIIGGSGSGKSTLIHLLQNIYPINGGHIYIGDYDLTYITNESLGKTISVVPQKIDLFSGNVIENIATGDINPDMSKILDLSHKLGMTGFIEKLPLGFQTYLGENGTSLSGGQKQRIAIARALYKDPSILIMDEATSSLDAFSNKYVKDTLEEYRNSGKTIIIITHKISSIANADKVFYIEDGHLVEEGSPNELYAAQGRYSKLVYADL